MIEKAYETLAKKHGLPAFEDLDQEFDLKSIEDTRRFSASIRKKILERIEPVAEFVEHLLQPDVNSLADMYECKYVDSEDKTHLFVCFRKLMKAYKSFLELELLRSEKEDCHFITTFVKEWEQIKKELLPIVIKMKFSWSTPTESKEVLEYLG